MYTYDIEQLQRNSKTVQICQHQGWVHNLFEDINNVKSIAKIRLGKVKSTNVSTIAIYYYKINSLAYK